MGTLAIAIAALQYIVVGLTGERSNGRGDANSG